MSIFSEHYAETYDDLYADKDYWREANFVQSVVMRHCENGNVAKTLLDLGSGTGRHLECFQKLGFSCTGVERSLAMASHSRKRLKGIDIYENDILNLNLKSQFNVVVSLFDVLSYQTSNLEVEQFFATLRNHLDVNGVGIVDFWHSSGLIKSPPAVRFRTLNVRNGRVVRVTQPSVNWLTNVTKLEIWNCQLGDDSQYEESVETHFMRAFSIQELELFATNSDLKVVESGPWFRDSALVDTDWHAYIAVSPKSRAQL